MYRNSSGLCTTCPPGSTPVVNHTACTECSIGTYGNSSGLCLDCLRGTFAPQPGALTCTPCPAGTFSTALHATSEDVCVNCGIGQYSEASSPTCLTCPAGTISTVRSGNCTATSAAPADPAQNHKRSTNQTNITVPVVVSCVGLSLFAGAAVGFLIYRRRSRLA